MGEKTQKAIPWAGLIAAIPALAVALQTYFETRSVRHDSEQTAERSEERDDKGWRFTRHILERQQDEIEALYERIEDLEEFVERTADQPTPLIKRIERHMSKPRAPDMPDDFDAVQKKAEDLPEF